MVKTAFFVFVCVFFVLLCFFVFVCFIVFTYFTYFMLGPIWAPYGLGSTGPVNTYGTFPPMLDLSEPLYQLAKSLDLTPKLAQKTMLHLVLNPKEST